MSEQKEQRTEKKKAGIAKRILKWLSFGLLTLLLIVSILLQGPWKVTTLLVILIAGTVPPKPYGKYFWLCVGGVVIALIIWVFLPEETEGWRPYTFDKELAVLEAKRAVPDEGNAAVIYNQLLEDYNGGVAFLPNFADPNLKNLIRKEFWLSKDHPEAAQWLEQQEGTIAKLLEASKIEQCRFQINTYHMDFGVGDASYQLGAMGKWAHLLISAANNDIAEGRTEEGLEKYIAVLQMGKHICQQPAIIDLMVGIALESLSTSNLKRFVITGDATEEQLDLIEKALTEIKYDWSDDLPRIIDYEKLYTKNYLGKYYAINPEGEIRLNPGYEAIERKKRYKLEAVLGWFFMPATPQKAGEIIDSEYKRFYAMAEPNFDWRKEPEKPVRMFRLNYRYLVKCVIRIKEPTFYSIHDTYLRTISQQRGALLTIALRRYKNKAGHWPDSLDEVKSLVGEEIFVDSINGGSFVYKLTDGNFELYSKGKNSIDENGQFSSTWDPNSHKEKIEEDDIAIWPPKPKRLQKPKGGMQMTNSSRAYISELKTVSGRRLYNKWSLIN
jgi:hypothetical protein